VSNGTSHAIAADALNDIFTLQNLRARQPRLRDGGGFDWRWTGPNSDPEWAWFFNRHGWFPDLWRAWETTHDERYREALLSTLTDWISTNPAPWHFSFSPGWRPLEAARRLLGSWLPLYDGIITVCSAPQRARFEASLEDHGRHLRRHHAWRGNHLVTEMLALVRLAVCVPHHPLAAGWLAYGLERLDRAYREQVYPDGAYKELSSHYQRIVTLSYQQLLDTFRSAGRDDLAAVWSPRVERLWIYIRELTTPAGFNPLNNDSDREPYEKLLRQHAPALAGRSTPHSVHFPWAGQTVFRDATNRNWGFFDAGPRGADHDHVDHLVFIFSVGRREFLVDNGRHSYAPGPWRDYFSGPAAHNILLLDDQPAEQGPRAVDAAPRRITFHRDHDYTFAWGDGVFATNGNPRVADWRRMVVYLRGLGWMVIDHLVTFGVGRLTTQWHWHPGCALPDAPDLTRDLFVSHRETEVRVVFSTTLMRCGATECFAGRSFPSPQGWFSDRYNQRQAAPVLLHHQLISGPVTNAWLFLTDATQKVTVEILSGGSIKLCVEGIRSFVVHPGKPGEARCSLGRVIPT
jgi:hypothetical protein